MTMFEPHIVMEGGSIDVNGKGDLLTTTSCLLNPNRNPRLNKEQIEEHLRAYYGVDNIIWLGDGIVGDDTDGHVDDICRFADEEVIITAVEENRNDENYEPLQQNLKTLKKCDLGRAASAGKLRQFLYLQRTGDIPHIQVRQRHTCRLYSRRDLPHT